MTEIREATIDDIPAIFRIRTAVKENAANIDRLREIGITPESVAQSFASNCKGWIADVGGEIVGFSIADTSTKSVWAVFILPEFEGRGLGKLLMGVAMSLASYHGSGSNLADDRPDNAGSELLSASRLERVGDRSKWRNAIRIRTDDGR